MTQEPFNWLCGFPKEKHQELLGLEYVLTWEFSDNPIADEKRHRDLSDELWALREQHPDWKPFFDDYNKNK